MNQKRAKEYAAKHGFKVRRVPHSMANPNGYIKIVSPKGSEHRAVDWSQAWETMMRLTYKK